VHLSGSRRVVHAEPPMHSPRRHFLLHSLAGAAVFSCGGLTQARDEPLPSPDAAVPPPATPTPSESGAIARAPQTCGRTAANIEGPFFRPGAPLATANTLSLTPSGAAGTRLQLVGCITDPQCQPLPGAMLEIWHADHHGDYDDEAFTYRGRVRVGADGRFDLRTIVPGHYRVGGGHRPAHIHVKVHANGRPSLTTQLYFEGDRFNAGDPFIHRSLIMPITQSGEGLKAAFDIAI